MSDTPIEDLALLSDCHSAALVSRTGSVEWWCVPRFDSPSVFGRLLDDRAGHFSLHVSGAERIDRVYEEGSLTLVTRIHTTDGECELTDALAMAEGVRGHDLGRGSPHRLLRRACARRGASQSRFDTRPGSSTG